MSSQRSTRTKAASSYEIKRAGADAPARTAENEPQNPVNINDNTVEAVADSNQGSESDVQCGICFDDITLRGVINCCEHTCKYF